MACGSGVQRRRRTVDERRRVSCGARFANPTLTITLMPNTNAPSRVAATRAIFAFAAALLRSFAGDAALTAQDANTCVLRIDGVVHVDRDQVPEEWLSAADVAPLPLVVGIPAIPE